MMKSSTVLLSLGLLFGTQANAAVMCIQDKATGLFEVKTEHGKFRRATADECSLETLQSALDVAPQKQHETAAATIVAMPAVTKPSPVQQAVAAVPEPTWDVRTSDATIYGSLKRWAKIAGWQLMWDTEGNDFPVVAEATYRGGFDIAIGGVMASLQRSQYPLRACLYENRAVRIIHKTKRCEG